MTPSGGKQCPGCVLWPVLQRRVFFWVTAVITLLCSTMDHVRHINTKRIPVLWLVLLKNTVWHGPNTSINLWAHWHNVVNWWMCDPLLFFFYTLHTRNKVNFENNCLIKVDEVSFEFSTKNKFNDLITTCLQFTACSGGWVDTVYQGFLLCVISVFQGNYGNLWPTVWFYCVCKKKTKQLQLIPGQCFTPGVCLRLEYTHHQRKCQPSLVNSTLNNSKV